MSSLAPTRLTICAMRNLGVQRAGHLHVHMRIATSPATIFHQLQPNCTKLLQWNQDTRFFPISSSPPSYSSSFFPSTIVISPRVGGVRSSKERECMIFCCSSVFPFSLLQVQQRRRKANLCNNDDEHFVVVELVNPKQMFPPTKALFCFFCNRRAMS